MFFPITILGDDLSQQRRIDAIELMELPKIRANEIEKIEQGLFKYNIMWWVNRAGYFAVWGIAYKGKLLDRAKVHGLGILRVIFIFWISTQYLMLGEFLSSSLLWEEYKYIYYKYEPDIRKKKIKEFPRFIRDRDMY